MHSHTLLHICTLQRYKKFQVLTNILPKTIILSITIIKINKNRQGNNKGDAYPYPLPKGRELSPPPDLPLGEGKGTYP